MCHVKEICFWLKGIIVLHRAVVVTKGGGSGYLVLATGILLELLAAGSITCIGGGNHYWYWRR